MEFIEIGENGEITIKQEIKEQLDKARVEKDTSAKIYKKLTEGIIGEVKKYAVDSANLGDYNFVVKGGTYTMELDVEKLKREHRAIYDSCLIPVKSNVSYSIATAKRSKKDE